MNRTLDDLLLRRGRLIERIASQRETLRQDFVPVSQALAHPLHSSLVLAE